MAIFNQRNKRSLRHWFSHQLLSVFLPRNSSFQQDHIRAGGCTWSAKFPDLSPARDRAVRHSDAFTQHVALKHKNKNALLPGPFLCWLWTSCGRDYATAIRELQRVLAAAFGWCLLRDGKLTKSLVIAQIELHLAQATCLLSVSVGVLMHSDSTI